MTRTPISSFPCPSGGRACALALALAIGGPAAAADLVVIASPSAASLSKQEIADVYLGKNQSAKPVDLPESTPLRNDFYSRVTGRDAAQVKSIWARLMFSGKGVPPQEVPDAAAVKKAVLADPKSIGYIEKSAVDPSVKVLLVVE